MIVSCFDWNPASARNILFFKIKNMEGLGGNSGQEEKKGFRERPRFVEKCKKKFLFPYSL